MKVAVRKGVQGFGFILSNQAPCVVSSIVEGGPAEIASLKSGDEVLEVNGQNVSRSTHQQVVRLILKTSRDWVTLKIRRYSDSLEFSSSYLDLAEYHDELHNSIIETVDKVVEDLKSGNLFQNSDNELKRRPYAENTEARRLPVGDANSLALYGSLQSMPPVNAGIDMDLGDLRRASLSGLPKAASDTQSVYSMLTAPLTVACDVFQAVVGYLCTVELPSGSSIQSACLNAMNNVTGGVNVTSRRINKRMLINISLDGVRLIDAGNKELVTYPLRTLAFTCSCPDDSRYFGIVTKKVLNEDSFIKFPATKLNNTCQQVHSCQIFMVDPELCSHPQHRHIANCFELSCAGDAVSNTCPEFPSSSIIVLNALDSFFQERSFSDSISHCSQDFATSQTNVEISNCKKMIDDEFSDGVNLIEKLKIREELEAQQEAKSEDRNSVLLCNQKDTRAFARHFESSAVHYSDYRCPEKSISNSLHNSGERNSSGKYPYTVVSTFLVTIFSVQRICDFVKQCLS